MRFLLLLIAILLPLSGRGSRTRVNAEGPTRGFLVEGRESAAESSSSFKPGRVLHPTPPPIELDALGRPVLSSVGWVHLAVAGPGFMNASLLDGRREADVATRRFRRNDWADPEGLLFFSRLLREWRRRRPQGPPILVKEVSGSEGGFPDFDGDGFSDHLTHQTGMNFDLFLPTKGDGRAIVHLGRGNEDAYDPQATLQLAKAAFDAGAFSITTSAATGLDRPEAARVLNLGPGREQAPGVVIHAAGVDRRQALILLQRAEDHGDRLNVFFFSSM